MLLTILDNVGDVENLRRKNSGVHFVAFAKARHLDDQTRRNFLQLDIRGQKRLLEKLLNCWKRQSFVFFHK